MEDSIYIRHRNGYQCGFKQDLKIEAQPNPLQPAMGRGAFRSNSRWASVVGRRIWSSITRSRSKKTKTLASKNGSGSREGPNSLSASWGPEPARKPARPDVWQRPQERPKPLAPFMYITCRQLSIYRIHRAAWSFDRR